jgi:hypothetical protein
MNAVYTTLVLKELEHVLCSVVVVAAAWREREREREREKLALSIGHT